MDLLIRILVGIATVIVTLIVLALVEEAPSEPRLQCVDERTREELRALTLQAIDTGLKEHVSHLFEVWVRDPAEQPKRATVGMQNGISAYLRARQNALAWNPPSC
jgi:hypothetical protein